MGIAVVVRQADRFTSLLHSVPAMLKPRLAHQVRQDVPVISVVLRLAFLRVRLAIGSMKQPL